MNKGEEGREVFTRHLPKTSPKTSRSFDGDDFVESHMTVLGVLEFKLLHGLAQMDTRAVVDFQRRVLLLHQR